MTRQNRVQPDGSILAHPGRGLFMGNRGILHDRGQLGPRRWTHPHWITCLTCFRGRKRPLMAPGAYTELFFLDEAVACAAGHRPCAECRNAEYRAFKAIWGQVFGPSSAAMIDKTLHAARLTPDRQQRNFRADARSLPVGTFLLWQGQPHLMTAKALHPYHPGGYADPVARPLGDITVLTPEPLVQMMQAGWTPHLHPSVAVQSAIFLQSAT